MGDTRHEGHGWKLWLLSGSLVTATVVAVAGGFTWWRHGHAERCLGLAEQAIREGDGRGALEWLEVSERSPRTRERALLLRARVAVESGQMAEAARALRGIDPHGPHAAGYAYWKGRALYAMRQPLLALAWFREASSRRPDDADTLRWLAAAAYDLGDRTAAVSALEAVTRLDPADARPWRTLGLIYKENVEYERARDAFQRALRLDTSLSAARLDLAEALIRLGDSAGAARELAAWKGHVEQGRHAELLAECLRLRGDSAAARAAIEAGLKDEPDRPSLLCLRAQLDQAEGHPERALESLNRAATIDPFRAATFYLRGLILRGLGRSEEARLDSERAARLNKQTAEMSALNEQADRHPHDAEVRYRLGQVCVELGKPELAASWYRAALACDPHHRAARMALSAMLASRPRGPVLGGVSP